MLIKRLYLRNFRVYEDELDLELPPGLVGIYGANGAGKSTLLEAILFTLWGKARTTKEQIRSSGVGGDCVTEVEFEHEGHLYLVRRTLRGINSQVSVEAHCDGLLMSTGTRDAERYVESVLGMDDGAFRASVFTEQKQLAAFSNQSPAERRRLVLQLLGITPLDAARDAARKDARDLASDHDRLRGMLADLDVLGTEAADAAARAEASDVAAREEATAAKAAADAAEQATAAYRAQDLRRQEHEGLVADGRAARQEMDRAEETASRLREQMGQLHDLEERARRLEEAVAGLDADEACLERMTTAAGAARAAEQVSVPDRPAGMDETEVATASLALDEARAALAAARARLEAARADRDRASAAAERSATLSGGEDCPTCGQPLGDAFETVQAHRAAEVAGCESRYEAAAAEVESLQQAAARASQVADALGRRAEKYRREMADWEAADRRRRDADQGLADAWSQAADAGAAAWLEGHTVGPPTAAVLRAAVERLREAVGDKRRSQAELMTTRGRLASRKETEAALTRAAEQAQQASERVTVLREKVRALSFRREELDAAEEVQSTAAAAAAAARTHAQEAALGAARDLERARSAQQRLEEARAQHDKLADLETEARHRGRAAELLSEFRNTVVASVGPRLADQAADLFGELTDHEYERIDVDPETYQLQICDGGRLYGLDRFSGSEIDLANLALRVAISEHIHFQSGGSVGLLVLDEVFGPLDDDRKARMLLALERLRGRFRQVLVVTHDTEIKEQMPNAIEVVKRPGRRATARVVGD